MSANTSGLYKLFKIYRKTYGDSFTDGSFSSESEDSEPEIEENVGRLAIKARSKRLARTKPLTFEEIFGAPLITRYGPEGWTIVDSLVLRPKQIVSVWADRSTQTPSNSVLLSSSTGVPAGGVLSGASSGPVIYFPAVQKKTTYRPRKRNRGRGGVKRPKIISAIPLKETLAFLYLRMLQSHQFDCLC